MTQENQASSSQNVTKTKSWIKRHPILSIIGALFVLGVIGSINGESPDTTKTKTPSVAKEEVKVEAIKLEAETLRQVYKANEVNGDAIYKNKLVEVSGNVDSIGKDVVDQAYITFKADEAYAFDKVQCMFRDSEQSVLASLKSGQKVTVQGTVSGVSISSVIIKNCKII